jgi:hypothetical protein
MTRGQTDKAMTLRVKKGVYSDKSATRMARHGEKRGDQTAELKKQQVRTT